MHIVFMKKFRKGVFIVTYTREKNKIYYLILKRKLHWKGWEFPKGGIDGKENLLTAIKRELKEETGHYPKKIKKYSLKGRYFYRKNISDRPNIIGQTYSLYTAEITQRKISIDKKEHTTYRWAEYKKALQLLTNANQKKCLKIVNKELIAC